MNSRNVVLCVHDGSCCAAAIQCSGLRLVEINNIIKFEAATSQGKSDTYQVDVVHRFESWPFEDHVSDPDIDELLNEFHRERFRRVSSEKRRIELDELNTQITLNEIKNAIDCSKADSSPYDDEFTAKSGGCTI